MSENLVVDNNLSKAEKYIQLSSQLELLLNENDPVLTNLSNFIAAINQTFDSVSWIGFYFVHNRKLFLGPFQGSIACTEIKFGYGVCGTSAEKRKTVIVKNVDEFPGHIACDSSSNSEIVIPIEVNNKLVGVLDIDSHLLSTFDETDQIHLEKYLSLLCSKIDFSKFLFS